MKVTKTLYLQIREGVTFSAAATADSSSIQDIIDSDFLKPFTISMQNEFETSEGGVSYAPVITLVPFCLESPAKVSFTKYLPVANPRAWSTLSTQYSARSPTAPGFIPCRTSRRFLTAFHDFVEVPSRGANTRAARLTRYASRTSAPVSLRMEVSERVYAGYVTTTSSG
jgi:hypothetical protein